MTKINYKSDFDFILHLKDWRGERTPWPDCDWSAVFWAGSKANTYTASCRDGVYTNCSPTEDGGMHFVFDKHRLGVGTLKWEPHFEFPNAAYPDGKEDLYIKEPLGIELMDGPRVYPTAAEVDALVPYIKFKYEDLTDEEKAEISKPATDAAATVRDLSEKTQELRREIVGLWDETAKIQAKLADLHSTETENLLKRLGYGAEDIEEYIWAVSHLDLDISLDDLRRSVAAWEAGEDRGQKVAPKWTEEMEAGEETPAGLKASRFNSALYYPHITTGKGFWIGEEYKELWYAAGLHATETCEVVIRPILRDGYGLGRFTGKISRFRLYGIGLRYYQSHCLKLLKSDIPIDLSNALVDQAYLDLGNVYVGNATAMNGFNACDHYPWHETSVPKELSETGNILLHGAFKGRKFVGETIDIKTEAVNCCGTFGDSRRWTEFDDCDIDLSQSTPPSQWNGFSYMGYFNALTKSRLKAHGFTTIEARALVSYQGKDFEHQHCGVWEVDCPDAEVIDTDYCAGATCATFWNLGSCLRAQTLRLDEAMVPYVGWTASGGTLCRNFIDKNEVLRESFRNSLRSWVKPLEPCIISLNDEQYKALTEEDIALLTDKGYTISRSGNCPVTTHLASFNFVYYQ
jgi:hypothetical protein